MIINAGMNGGQTPVGQNVELVGNIFSQDIAFKDTDYNGWTPSSTQTTIIDNLVTDEETVDMANYEYAVRWLIDSQIVYTSGSNKSRPYRLAAVVWNYVVRDPGSVASFVSGTTDNAMSIGTAAYRYLFYYNSSGSARSERGSSYGVGLTLLANTIADASADVTTVLFRNPQIWVRCNSTRFSTANAALLDQDNSVIKLRASLFRMRQKKSLFPFITDEAIDLYNNPL